MVLGGIPFGERFFRVPELGWEGKDDDSGEARYSGG